MNCMILLGFLGMAFSSVLVIGCERSAVSYRQRGLLTDAGLANPASVRMILVGGTCVTDVEMICQLYGAVNKPDRDWTTKMARNHQIAFVGANGRVAYLGYSEAGDLTERQGSSRLMRLLMRVSKSPSCKLDTHVKIGSLVDVSVVSNGASATFPRSPQRFERVRKRLTELVGLWSPNDTRGCQRVDEQELGSLPSRHITVDVAEPITFGTLIVPKRFKWWPPPDKVYGDARYDDIRSRRIRIMNTREGEMRLAFADQPSGGWILASPVSTRRFLGYDKAGRARSGPDLFAEIMSLIHQ